MILALATSAFAQDKEITITGEGQMRQMRPQGNGMDKCQNVIEVEKNGKTRKYFLVQNDISKAFHENVCKETKKVTATGTVKRVDGKLEFTATKIELVK